MFKLKFYRKFVAKGYTLLEVIVSIGIFGIVSITLSNVLLNISYLSNSMDRRNEILHLINSITTIISNEIMASDKITFCPSNNNTAFYLERSFGNNVVYKLIRFSNNNLLLQESSSVPNNCQIQNPSQTLVLNTNDTKITNFATRYSTDGNDNLLIYILFNLCDNDNVPASRVVFKCNQNPYKHVFAVNYKKI